jgi:hypothetical protein
MHTVFCEAVVTRENLVDQSPMMRKAISRVIATLDEIRIDVSADERGI